MNKWIQCTSVFPGWGIHPLLFFQSFSFFCFSFSLSSLKPHWGLNSKNRNQFKALWGKFVILSYMNKTEWEFFDSFIHSSIYSWFSLFLFLRIYLVLELLKGSCILITEKCQILEWISKLYLSLEVRLLLHWLTGSSLSHTDYCLTS